MIMIVKGTGVKGTGVKGTGGEYPTVNFLF